MDDSTIVVIIVLLFFLVLIYLFISLRFSCSDTKKNMRVLLRQSARWAVAAIQDKNNIVSVLHINYAAGYLWALDDLYMSSEIEHYGNVDYSKYKEELLKLQDFITQRLAKSCPEGVGFDLFKDYPSLTQIAGYEEIKN